MIINRIKQDTQTVREEDQKLDYYSNMIKMKIYRIRT